MATWMWRLPTEYSQDGDLDVEITHGVQSGWKNWSVLVFFELPKNQLRDRRKVQVRAAMMYGERKHWMWRK